MDSDKCKPCTNNLFKSISSNPDLQDLVDLIVTDIGNVTVVGDDEFIFVTLNQTGDDKEFKVRYEPYIPLSINSFNDDVALQLLGNTVDDFTLSWTYNKGVETQSISNLVNASAPAVEEGKTSYSLALTGQGVTSDTTYQLTADDDTGDSNAAKTRNTSILFGNYIYRTQIAIADRDNITTTTINSIDLTTISRTLKRDKSLTFTAESVAGEYEAIFVPTRFGVSSGANFQDTATGFTGGWGKLFTMSLTNEAGFSEDFDIFVSSNKNLEGLTFQII